MSKRKTTVLFANAHQREAAEEHRASLRDDLGWSVTSMVMGPNGWPGFRVHPPQNRFWHWREFDDRGNLVVTK